MLSKEFYNQILYYYEEYKEKYNERNLIGIIPCEDNDDTMLAHTNNDELMNCIKNMTDVKLYISPKITRCTEQYIRAVLFHEFTHISDAYIFAECDNVAILMSTYSEFNATKIEIVERCKNKPITLNEVICGEEGNITIKEEVEDKISTIAMILEMTQKDLTKIIKDKKDAFLFNYLIKTYSYLSAYLSFFEETEPKYFEDCFDKMNEYEQLGIGKRIYYDIQCLDKILNNPEIIIGDIVELHRTYFEQL